MKHCGVVWDSIGRSTVKELYVSNIKGAAVIEYDNEEDAARAIKEYNGRAFKQ